MKLAVVGTGYVGLVTGAGFASRGHDVTCVDIDQSKVAALTVGDIPWYEPGLDKIVRDSVREGRLKFTTSIADAAGDAELLFIAVGTPSSADGSADTTAVFRAGRDIGRAIGKPVPVVIRSTVPVGTATSMRRVIAEEAGFSGPVLSNPEFLREGRAVEDFENPVRVVIGSDQPGGEEPLKELYSSYVPDELILVTDCRSAEMSKYACNVFLAAKVSLMNELAELCEGLEADVDAVRRVMGMDPRIGAAHLFPGIGYGGSCLPKDTRALVHMASQTGTRARIVEQVHEVNTTQASRLVEKLNQRFNGSLKSRRIAIWGLAFKPDTDDMREAPSLTVIQELTKRGAQVSAHDPMAMPNARAILNGAIKFSEDMFDCVRNAEALIVVTEWSEYRDADWLKVRDLMAQPIVVDGRNICRPAAMAALGFEYLSVGRPASRKSSILSNSTGQQTSLGMASVT